MTIQPVFDIACNQLLPQFGLGQDADTFSCYLQLICYVNLVHYRVGLNVDHIFLPLKGEE